MKGHSGRLHVVHFEVPLMVDPHDGGGRHWRRGLDVRDLVVVVVHVVLLGRLRAYMLMS